MTSSVQQKQSWRCHSSGAGWNFSKLFLTSWLPDKVRLWRSNRRCGKLSITCQSPSITVFALKQIIAFDLCVGAPLRGCLGRDIWLDSVGGSFCSMKPVCISKNFNLCLLASKMPYDWLPCTSFSLDRFVLKRLWKTLISVLSVAHT